MNSIFALVFSCLVFLFSVQVSAQDGDANPHDSAATPEEGFEAAGANFEYFYKFTAFLDDSGRPARLLFQNLQKFDRHGDFLATLPEFAGLSQAKIDDLTYKAVPKRVAILGVLTLRSFDDGVSYNHLNLAMEGNPTLEQVEAIYQLVVQAAGPFEYAPLEFQALPHQEAGMVVLGPALRARGVPVAVSAKPQERIPYTNAWNLGTLIWVSSQDDLNAKVEQGLVNAHSILATDQSLRDFPPVAGLISALPLTSASHSVLLAQMYGAPVVFIKNARRLFSELSGQRIFLNAVLPPGSFLSERAVDYVLGVSDKDSERMLEFKSQPSLKIALDITENRIRSARELNRSNISAYGGKASQMGLIMTTIPEMMLAEAAAIPVSYYKTFVAIALASSGVTLEKFIAQNLELIKEGQESSAASGEILARIRSQIEDATLPGPMAAEIRATLEQMFPGDSVRLKLRSSSNVEDGAEFNGAGLYDSKGAWLKGGKAGDLEKTLKEVWASLYTQRGFVARRRFRVDETQVAMGVLVHKTFKGELFNGVASLYLPAEGEAHFECVTQVGEDLVTHANGEVQAEQVEISFDHLRVTQPYEGFSDKRTLMKSQDYKTLRAAMLQLAEHYKTAGGDVHIEIEWKQMPTNQGPTLFIKQVRPIPRSRLQTARDGSNYFVLVPGEVVLPEIEMPGDAMADLLSPKHVRIRMSSFSEQEFLAGNVSVIEVQYEVQGQVFTVKNPAVAVNPVVDPGAEPSLQISLAHPVLKSLRISLSIATLSGRNVLTPFGIGSGTIEFGAGESDFKWSGQAFDHYSLHSYAVITDEDLSGAFYDDSVVGTGQYLLTIDGKQKIEVSLNEVKERGEGDGLRTKIGSAVITGVLSRPLNIPKVGIGYGGDHHSGLESFVFDLFADPSLSVREKERLLRKMGRYLALNSGEYDGDHTAVFLKESGRAKSAGTWEKVQIKAPVWVLEGPRRAPSQQ